MISNRTLKVAVAMAGLFVLNSLGPQLLRYTSQVYGQEATKGRHPVKVVFSVDYPVGGKDKYMAWAKSVAKDLTAPDELRRLTSYDSYLGTSPHRIIEFEFDSMEDATKYFEKEKIQAISEAWQNYGVNMKMQQLTLRGDYAPK